MYSQFGVTHTEEIGKFVYGLLPHSIMISRFEMLQDCDSLLPGHPWLNRKKFIIARPFIVQTRKIKPRQCSPRCSYTSTSKTKRPVYTPDSIKATRYPYPLTHNLKDAVDNVSSNGSTGTENSSVTQLLTKLLAILVHLVVLAISLLSRAFSYGHGRHARIIRVLLRRRTLRVSRVTVLRLSRSLHGLDGLLGLLVHEHVVAREDTLLACALVSAHPPVLVHVFVDSDTIVLLEGQIATVGGGVAV